MDKKITNLCDLTIDNYKIVKEELRYDGEYINHFASLIYANLDREIPFKKIKKIRSYIKEKTSRMSCFKGDILYILSFLVAIEENVEEFIDNMIEVYEMLIEIGFKESQYLVITAYSLLKYSDKENIFSEAMKTKEIYDLIKKKYANLTDAEDYVGCALLVLSDIESDDISNYLDLVFNTISDLDMFSKNGLQGLAMSVVLSKKASQLYKIDELLVKLEEEGIKISHQFLPLLGIAESLGNVENYLADINETIEYLREEDSSYNFFMDKSFIIFIAIAINEFAKNNNKERYLNELISVCVYSFLVSKNQGVFSEVLA